MWKDFKQLINAVIPIDNELAFDTAQGYFREVKLTKGEHFIQEGQICRKLAYVHRGILRSYYYDDKGNDITYCFCTDHHMETSFKSFIETQPSFLSIVAMEDTAMLVIEKADLNKLLETELFWNKLVRILVEQEYLKMADHAAEAKTEKAKNKYLNLLAHRPRILQQVPLHYIASYLGISGRHLTRLRREVALGKKQTNVCI